MKQLNISLTDGFKLRSLLKRKTGNVANDISSLPISYDPDLEGKRVEIITGKYGSVDKMIDLCLKLQETLGELNVKIDAANVEIRPLLDRKETLDAKTATISRILSSVAMSSISVKKEFNSVTGKYDITELSQTFTDQKLAQLTELNKSINRQIHELEEQISSLNGKTMLSFGIDEDIYNYIYDL